MLKVLRKAGMKNLSKPGQQRPPNRKYQCRNGKYKRNQLETLELKCTINEIKNSTVDLNRQKKKKNQQT